MAENKCYRCESKQLELIGSNHSRSRSYEKVVRSGNMTTTESGSISIPIHKFVCLECGYVFEKVLEEHLIEYKALKEYFI